MLPTLQCSGCRACASVCGQNCIAFTADKDGFCYPDIDGNRCVDCKACERVCPVLKRQDTEKGMLPTAYAAYIRDDVIRRGSSSGGVFTAVAESVLERGGVVFGAGFDDALSVHHICVEDIEELPRLRGSKYVQSNIGSCYQKAKQYLADGRFVLFSGTPCQIEGLLSYLGRPYDNLLTADVICHGVPSEKVWQEYLKWQSRRYGSKALAANFRDKVSGWEQFSLSVVFENGKRSCQKLDEDSYMRAFLENLCLRESCYQCSFKAAHHKSDLTIGDLWGIQKIAAEWNDHQGISLILVQSNKGAQTLDAIARRLAIRQVDSALAIANNGAMTHSVYRHPFRKYFFQKLGKRDFGKLVDDCLEPGYLVRLERKLIEYVD